jgi:hypothetical protein
MRVNGDLRTRIPCRPAFYIEIDRESERFKTNQTFRNDFIGELHSKAKAWEGLYIELGHNDKR